MSTYALSLRRCDDRHKKTCLTPPLRQASRVAFDIGGLQSETPKASLMMTGRHGLVVARQWRRKHKPTYARNFGITSLANSSIERRVWACVSRPKSIFTTK